MGAGSPIICPPANLIPLCGARLSLAAATGSSKVGPLVAGFGVLRPPLASKGPKT